MDDRMRHDVETHFAREARGLPPAARERVLARLNEAAARPGRVAPPRRVEWFAAVAAILVGVSVIGALVTIGMSAARPGAGQPGGTPPPSRSAPAVALDGANGTLVLFGGTSNQAVLDDTWVRDGHGWRQAHPTTSPPARQGGLAVYDEAHRVTVLFGGADAAGRGLADTWTWDGRGWTQKVTGVAPPASGASSIVYDPATRTVLLYVWQGKGDEPGSSLWSWDGTSWTRLAGGPEPAISGDLLRDGRRILLVGASGGTPARETWAWTGGTWSRLSPATDLPALAVAGAAYDRSRGRAVVLLDGAARTETWIWDGTTWSRLHPVHQPPPSSGGWLLWDPRTSGLEWYGPAQPDGGTQIWRWDGTDWTHVVTERGTR